MHGVIPIQSASRVSRVKHAIAVSKPLAENTLDLLRFCRVHSFDVLLQLIDATEWVSTATRFCGQFPRAV